MASDDRVTTPARYFTPSEANERLPGVIERMDAITEHLNRARALTESARDHEADTFEHRAVLVRLDDVKREISDMVDALHADGIEVKGLAPGLVDFPALMNGREVYLCWREGETRIDWWHPVHTGVAGRQRLDPALFGAFEWCN